MAIQIKLKNSVVQDSTPSTSDLPAVGEIALNANINSIGGFMRASDNTIVKIFGPGSVTTPTATTTVSGIAELATNSETTAGSATNRVVTPAGLNAVTTAERTTSNSTYLALAGGTLTGVVAATAGSNSAPSIHFGDSDSGIFGGTNTVSLAAGGTTRLTADTGVSVVGTLAVTGAITSTSDLTIPDKIIHSGDTDTAIRFPAANAVSVETGGSEALRVDSSQRLLVGTTSATSIAGFAHRFQVVGSNVSEVASFLSQGNFNGGCRVALGSARNNTIVQDNDQLGEINFFGHDGVDLNTVGASIEGLVDGTPGENDMPGRLVFSTTADGASSPTERLRIDSAGLVKLPDNGKFVAGAGSDLQIYHDGTNSIIENSTGNLQVIEAGQFRGRANGYVFNSYNDQEGIIKGFADGAVELYHDGSKKFETTANGATLFGYLFVGSGTSNWGFLANDSTRIGLGTSQDLILQHDGSDSILTSATGSLNFGINNSFNILGGIDLGEYMARFIDNGAVQLYYDGSKKLETTTTGVLISNQGNNRILDIHNTNGNNAYIAFLDQNTTDNSYVRLGATANEMTIFSGGGEVLRLTSNQDVNIPTDGKKLQLGASQDLQIFHDGTNSRISDNGTGNLMLDGNEVHIQSNDNTKTIAKFITNGAVELYYDNVKRLETFAFGAQWTGQFQGPVAGDSIQWTGSSNNAFLLAMSDGSDLPANSSTGFNFHHWNGSAWKRTHHFGRDQLYMPDNVKLLLGTSNDIEIFHDGTDSFIKDDTSATLVLMNNDLRLKSSGDEMMVRCIANDTVKLMYDGSTKLETTSVGAKVTGTNPVLEVEGTATSGDAALFLDANANHWLVRADNNTSAGTFSIKSGTPSSSTHRLLINNTGKVGINTTSPNKRLEILEDTDSAAVLRINRSTNVDSTQRDFIEFMRGTNAVGFIKSTNSSVAYLTSSDYRLKENAVAISDGITRLKTLKPYRFNFKAAPDTTIDGFFAHEITAVPEAISGTKDEVDSNGDPVYQGIDQSKLVPLLVAAVQELIGRVEKLEAA